MVLASALRLLTCAKIFVQPTPMKGALRFIDALMAMPGVRGATLGPEWPQLRQLCLDKALAGNDLPDAWLAAAVEHQGGQRPAAYFLLGGGLMALPPGATRKAGSTSGGCT